jgi:hypothetical protein
MFLSLQGGLTATSTGIFERTDGSFIKIWNGEEAVHLLLDPTADEWVDINAGIRPSLI